MPLGYGGFTFYYIFNNTDMTRDEYFGLLLELFTEYIEAGDIADEIAIQDNILAFIEKNEVPDSNVGKS